MTKKQLNIIKQWLNEINHAWEDGAREERQNVVAWLRAEAQLTLYDDKPDDIADRIERGEHRREETK